MSKSWLVAVLLLLSVLSTGCVTIYSRTEVLRGDEQRRAAQFENARAAALFHGELGRRSQEVGGTRLGVPFLTLYRRRQILSDNAFFNDQLQCCDADHDGLVTLQEAAIYSGSPPEHWSAVQVPEVDAKIRDGR